ncbi:MAG: hypothetical protein DRJ15_01620 [Bacteroidetes bacterium]|nr:MAG: hypothetical protein DRJ15_01620 [Bacteroidota bacterium]
MVGTDHLEEPNQLKEEIMARKEFKMTDAQWDALIEACKPVRYIIVAGHEPASPQENANRAWKALGKELGFEFMTVQPVSGKDSKCFTAEETENER